MTLEITGTTQWQAWQDRVLPPVERVRDGLWSIPVPIPDNPLRYVLVYALESGDGVALVDAGWPAETSWQALCDGLAQMGTAVEHVKAVLVTHNHADHLGLAGRVREASGAYVALHALDAAPLGAREVWRTDLLHHLTRHGMPAPEAAGTVDALNVDLLFGAPEPDVLLQDEERVRLPDLDLTVLWTPGHSPGHSCFHEPRRRLLFSGDHVLPRITPAVGVYARTVGDPLADFLASLDRLERYEVEEVLPAHEYRFRRLDQRLVQMARHHTERLAETYAAVRAAPGATAWELAAELEWSRPWGRFGIQQRRFALGETLAHLTLLRARREITASDSEPTRWHVALA
ncbi:MBL fold metallo-hydrolase [Streptomyces sp. LHD-70]|uniref:MBL fold metallo-hydrolase n=1 Tax=Streptomyces sp. LHD-70 TaxID=3072140 RepID=UPI00280F6DD8|nr:MBL fold metallo-hydrolase [Streptomyces sp. LHD-70]MDQ8703957.1 MBL fold metallo-hydrolase [Streptomyces sp. LHD-70]